MLFVAPEQLLWGIVSVCVFVRVCAAPSSCCMRVLMSPVEAHPFQPAPEQWLCRLGELGTGSMGEGPLPVRAFPAGRSSAAGSGP